MSGSRGPDDDADVSAAVVRELREIHDRLDELAERVESVESSAWRNGERFNHLLTIQARGRSAAETYGQVLQGAINRANTGGREGGVALDSNDIQTLTGCSRQHTYRLMESMSDEYEFCEVREPTEIPNRANKRKALLVHVEANRQRVEYVVNATQ